MKARPEAGSAGIGALKRGRASEAGKLVGPLPEDPERNQLLVDVAGLLIDLKRFRRESGTGGGKPNAMFDFFQEHNTRKTPESTRMVSEFKRLFPLTSIIAVSRVLDDPEYFSLLRRVSGESSWQNSLAVLLPRAGALLKRQEVPNVFALDFDRLKAAVDDMAQEAEKLEGEARIPELFLSDDFLAFNALDFIEPVLRQVLVNADAGDLLGAVNAAD